MSEVLLGRNNVDLLVHALLQVPELADSDVRDALALELEAALRRPFDVTRFADSRLDVSALTNACLAYSGGLRTFGRILRRRYPGPATDRFAALADDLLGPALLSPSDREALHGHLAGIAIVQVADAVGELVDAAELRSLQSWRDIPSAIRAMERLPLPDDGVPQLLTFTDRLAHLVGGTRGEQLRQWTETVAGGLGVTASTLADMRETGERGPAAGRPSVSGVPRESSPTGEALPPRSGLIWGGGVPIRNRNFTGRVALLNRLGEALRQGSKASVLPQTLHGMGGVGKTQLVVEYVYRHLDEYDLVWWIPAELTSTALSSLSQLADRLGLAISEDQQRTARTVLDALASSDLSWLLVYDNADQPEALDQFIPSTGGHVILTSRNQDWATVGPSIEVDVFERAESVEMLQKRTRDEDSGVLRISASEANELAEKLGDLPLALEQAAAWHLATAMPVGEYLELLDSQIKDLLSEGKPAKRPLW